LNYELRPGEQPQTRRDEAPESLRRVVMERGAPAPVGPASQARLAIFPGAFHPLHEGHRGIAEVAARKLNRPVAYEISVLNVDKPPLDYTEIHDRLAQFGPSEGVWLTAAPTFVEKSRDFPGAAFKRWMTPGCREPCASYAGRCRRAISGRMFPPPSYDKCSFPADDDDDGIWKRD
jgi:hypothetical protein